MKFILKQLVEFPELKRVKCDLEVLRVEDDLIEVHDTFTILQAYPKILESFELRFRKVENNGNYSSVILPRNNIKTLNCVTAFSLDTSGLISPILNYISFPNITTANVFLDFPNQNLLFDPLAMSLTTLSVIIGPTFEKGFLKCFASLKSLVNFEVNLSKSVMYNSGFARYFDIAEKFATSAEGISKEELVDNYTFSKFYNDDISKPFKLDYMNESVDDQYLLDLFHKIWIENPMEAVTDDTFTTLNRQFSSILFYECLFSLIFFSNISYLHLRAEYGFHASPWLYKLLMKPSSLRQVLMTKRAKPVSIPDVDYRLIENNFIFFDVKARRKLNYRMVYRNCYSGHNLEENKLTDPGFNGWV
ncbi:uncharacterized protein SAPINGB_P004526 [Magnusiomyces paraingens]|uniref:Uncharacterized protein n=1 Tax=Magnusiomyces paraingens TaxID=2606893 RepID=A0A5E8C0G4_9ASCO|nr:uncharacterized protein SAPINGB_P004526 [Saprochaete ingens]VVT55297.1 unnamed protein product [Saprochaete ingens]